MFLSFCNSVPVPEKCVFKGLVGNTAAPTLAPPMHTRKGDFVKLLGDHSLHHKRRYII